MDKAGPLVFLFIVGVLAYFFWWLPRQAIKLGTNESGIQYDADGNPVGTYRTAWDYLATAASNAFEGWSPANPEEGSLPSWLGN